MRCVMLASMGMSNKPIMEQTGFTPGQIAYRLRRAGIYRRYYRDGISDVAERMMGYIPKSNAAIRDLLRLTLIK